MRNVFLDAQQQKDFDEKGYVIVPFLSASEVENLKQTFFDLLPSSQGNITPEDEGVQSEGELTYDFTFTNKNISYKESIFKVVSEVFSSKANEYLDRYKPIIANYIRKKPGDGEVPLHQNWAFVDEHEFTSVSVWCPLVPSNSQNGTLQVVPGSHKRFGEIRGPMVPWELEKIRSEIIDDYLIPLEVDAGTAVILCDSIVHYSDINKSDDLRLAIQLIMTPEEVPSIHHYMDQSKSMTEVEVLEVDKDFYMSFNPWKKPGEVIRKRGTLKFQEHDLTISEFAARLKKPGFDHNQKGVWDRVKAIFN